MTLVFMNVYVLHLQKPKSSETAVQLQLKQHQINNSKFPSVKTREKEPSPVSTLGFEWAMDILPWLCSPIHAKRRLVFGFWFFVVVVIVCLFYFFPLAIDVPASVIGRRLILQLLCSTECMLLVYCAHLWTTGHCSSHLVRWKMKITHWTSQGDHLPKRFTVLDGNKR